jgi:hypothetical protein
VAKSCSLGGAQFSALNNSSTVTSPTSTNSQGRHGTSNLWSKWPKIGSKKKGISARSPWDMGNVKTPTTLGGTQRHNTGLNLGPHGHGIGVVHSNFGGSMRKGSGVPLMISTGNVGSAGGKTLTPAPGVFCIKCFSVWFAAGVVLVIILVAGR